MDVSAEMEVETTGHPLMTSAVNEGSVMDFSAVLEVEITGH